MLSTITSAALSGIEAQPVQIEVSTGQTGDPRCVLVGLPDTAVRESQDRVFSALINSGYKQPTTRTTINLAPGHLRKEGPIYDLPIALALLVATRQIITPGLDDFIIAGELSLSGQVRAFRGAFSMALLARRLKKRGILLPAESVAETCLVPDIEVYAIESLHQAVSFLTGKTVLIPIRSSGSIHTKSIPSRKHTLDFSEVKGQRVARRAAEIAVAGGHNLLMMGPPGAGKSMIANRLPTVMPDACFEESLEILGVYSAAGMHYTKNNQLFDRPFRAPHHTVSTVGLIGGGTFPVPGEISLAHNGVLFMDELPEYKRSCLEVLRQPLEEGTISISRSTAKIDFPCKFMLVAAMNPCPCGYASDKQKQCRCSAFQIERYRSRLSGPLLDRIDIQVEVESVSIGDIQVSQQSEASNCIRIRVIDCRALQYERFKDSTTLCNARMLPDQIRMFCQITPTQAELLQKAMHRLSLSARAYNSILKLARTIADLAHQTEIQTHHLLEAIQYRVLDRKVVV